MVVSYRYPSVYVTFDYRLMREMALYYTSAPLEDVPDGQWEAVNLAFILNATKTFNVSGITSQIQVRTSVNDPILLEPGNHGSTITIGEVTQLDHPWVNNFEYDCTVYSSLSEQQASLYKTVSCSHEDNDDNEGETWRAVAIIFIIATVLLSGLSGYLTRSLFSNKKRGVPALSEEKLEMNVLHK